MCIPECRVAISCRARLLLVAMAVFSLGLSAGAEEWWARSWFRQTDQKDGLQFHVSVSGGGEDLAGNESGTKIGGRGMIAIRKKFITFYTDGSFSRENKEYGILGTLEQTKFMGRETVRCDMGERIYASLGWITEREDVTFVRGRQGVFLGLGRDWSVGEKFNFTTYGAWGHDSVDYDVVSSASFYSGVAKESSVAYILSCSAVWQFHEKVSLRPDGMWVIYSTDELEDRWEAGTSLQFDVAPHLSLLLRYEERTEENPVLEAIGGDSKNTAFKTMFQIRY